MAHMAQTQDYLYRLSDDRRAPSPVICTRKRLSTFLVGMGRIGGTCKRSICSSFAIFFPAPCGAAMGLGAPVVEVMEGQIDFWGLDLTQNNHHTSTSMGLGILKTPRNKS